MIKKQRAPKAESPKVVETEVKQPSKGKTTLYLALLLVVVLTGVALMISQKMKARQEIGKAGKVPGTVQNQDKGQAKPMEKTDISALVGRVSQLILIKTDEDPTIATVQDANTLRASNPVFYKDAQNGDRLLVWSDKAVLYSTTQDKLLAVMPIVSNQNGITGQSATSTTTTNNGAQASAGDVASEKAVVDVRNGTLVAGQAKTMSALLKSKGIAVGTVGDAKVKNYEKTVIIKLTDKEMPATLSALKQALNAEVVELPAAETGLKGDFAVIVGKNFAQ